MPQVKLEQTPMDKTLKFAEDRRVLIKIATRAGDSKLEGVHLINPSIEEIDDAILSASSKGIKKIIIHCALTWPQKGN